MRAVVCRVESAKVAVDGRTVGAIATGLLAYIGVITGDGPADATWLGGKLTALRVFPDEAGRMNRSAVDAGGGVLLIPNFTLAARTRKGTRPSFTDAADPALATSLFENLRACCAERVHTETGRFGADMRIDARFDGPVTLMLDSQP
jgi:D-tyrosyl-tRNA(Tyr) deacylase